MFLYITKKLKLQQTKKSPCEKNQGDILFFIFMSEEVATR
jgi:hypothetical protein